MITSSHNIRSRDLLENLRDEVDYLLEDVPKISEDVFWQDLVKRSSVSLTGPGSLTGP